MQYAFLKQIQNNPKPSILLKYRIKETISLNINDDIHIKIMISLFQKGLSQSDTCNRKKAVIGLVIG